MIKSEKEKLEFFVMLDIPLYLAFSDGLKTLGFTPTNGNL